MKTAMLLFVALSAFVGSAAVLRGEGDETFRPFNLVQKRAAYA